MAPDTRTLESELPTDQASILQDLANGAAADSAYAADEGTEDPNGADSNLDYLFEDDEDDTYPIAGLETSFQDDLEDPAALLESLANYEPPLVTESRAPPVLNDHDHFESLLQAAATAEGVEAASGDLCQVGDSSELFDLSDAYEYFKGSFGPIDTTNKRKRGQEDASDDDSHMLIRSTSKRYKKTSQEDAEQLALERELWGPEEGEDEYDTPTSERHVSPVPTADARAAGLHSATALFRRPSVASKKYTRECLSLRDAGSQANIRRCANVKTIHLSRAYSRTVSPSTSRCQTLYAGPELSRTKRLCRKQGKGRYGHGQVEALCLREVVLGG